MKAIIKTGAVVALSAAVIIGSSASNADAQWRRGRVVGGVAAGLVAGAIIAGAASSAYARDRAYAGCGQYRRNAVYNEEVGRPGRAQYWWDRYAACRGD